MPQESSSSIVLPPLGLGTCRFHPSAASALVEAAWNKGFRLFITLPSSDDGFAESALGEWRAATEHAPLVISSVGLLEGILYHEALQREREGKPYPELVRLREGVLYCIHPEFVRIQLDAIRSRLRQHALAGIVLQQPELFLQWALEQGLPLDEAQHELLRRLEQTFAFLEQECRQGRLAAYGIQSEALLPQALNTPVLPLPELSELARSVAGDQHHFRLVLHPFNLFESAAATEPTFEGLTLLEYATEHRLSVIAYRPLNARINGRPVLIAEPPLGSSTLVSVEHIRGQLREFVHTETQLLRALTELPLDGVQRDMVRESLTLSLFLQDHWHEFASYEDWLRVQAQYIHERLRSLATLVEPLLTTEPAQQAWTTYTGRLQQVLSDIARLYAARAWERARRIRTVVEDALGIGIPPIPLAPLALALVRHTEGISSVIVSSGSTEHIAENAIAEQLQLPQLQRSHWLQLHRVQTVLEHGF